MTAEEAATAVLDATEEWIDDLIAQQTQQTTDPEK